MVFAICVYVLGALFFAGARMAMWAFDVPSDPDVGTLAKVKAIASWPVTLISALCGYIGGYACGRFGWTLPRYLGGE